MSSLTHTQNNDFINAAAAADPAPVSFSIVPPDYNPANEPKTNIPYFFTQKEQQNKTFVFNNILTKNFELKHHTFKSPEILFSKNGNYCITPHNKLYFNINKMMIIYKFISNTEIHYVYNIYQKTETNKTFEKIFEWKMIQS